MSGPTTYSPRKRLRAWAFRATEVDAFAAYRGDPRAPAPPVKLAGMLPATTPYVFLGAP